MIFAGAVTFEIRTYRCTTGSQSGRYHSTPGGELMARAAGHFQQLIFSVIFYP